MLRINPECRLQAYLEGDAISDSLHDSVFNGQYAERLHHAQLLLMECLVDAGCRPVTLTSAWSKFGFVKHNYYPPDDPFQE